MRKYRYCMATAVRNGVTIHPVDEIYRLMRGAVSDLREHPDADCWTFWCNGWPEFEAAPYITDITVPEIGNIRVRVDRGF